jgi:hypothetical protein
MNTSKVGVSSCRHCQYYRAEGRRGGHCQQLGAQVQGGWRACSLAIPPFAPAWENFEGIMAWQENVIKMADVIHTEHPHVVEPQKVTTIG